jgi:hypothetical protein
MGGFSLIPAPKRLERAREFDVSLAVPVIPGAAAPAMSFGAR